MMIFFKTFAKSSFMIRIFITLDLIYIHINLPPVACKTRSLQNETISKRNQTNSPNCLHVVRAQFVPSWGNSMFFSRLSGQWWTSTSCKRNKYRVTKPYSQNAHGVTILPKKMATVAARGAINCCRSLFFSASRQIGKSSTFGWWKTLNPN